MALDVWQLPPLDKERSVLTGTAAGMAREIGIDPIYVRVLLVILTVAGGYGALIYGVAWLFMQRRSNSGGAYEPIPKGITSRSRHVGFAALAFGLVLLMTATGSAFQPAIVWPVALIGAAVALAFDQQLLDWHTASELEGGSPISMRLIGGAALLVGGVVAAVLLNFSFWQAVRSVAIAGLISAGLALLFAPVLARTADELLAERRRRIRSEERADMAAHLHDSVLQTLALIQKRSDDVGVVNLARRQERELRSWLFGEKSGRESLGFRAALDAVMAEVEDLHEIPIEVVVVGDRPSDMAMEPILGASREAATNAARHSGSPRIDVFAEVRDDRVEVFVRDQGTGFDPDDVPVDRAGIRDSIRARMERHGGEAVVFSRPGSGTEVELSLPLEPSDDEETTHVRQF